MFKLSAEVNVKFTILKENNMADTLLNLFNHNNFIRAYKPLVKVVGLNATVLFSFICTLEENEEGYMLYQSEHAQSEIVLGEKEQLAAINMLVKNGFLEKPTKSNIDSKTYIRFSRTCQELFDNLTV